jgi:hypothetical protein
MYNPVLATYRLEHTPMDRTAGTLSAWSIGQQATIAIFTALGGLLAAATSPRAALTVMGLLILASALLLPRRDHTPSTSRNRPQGRLCNSATPKPSTAETGRIARYRPVIVAHSPPLTG